VIPHAFGERAELKLMYATLIRLERTEDDRFRTTQLKAIRDELDRDFAARTAASAKPKVTASPWQGIPCSLR
jgi:hypothetical protein